MTSPIVTLLQNKGGVGKTTLTLTLAATSAAAGARVLVVDADQQTNATFLLDPHNTSEGDFTIYDATADGAPPGSAFDAALPTAWSDMPSIQANGGGVDLLAGDTQFNESHIARNSLHGLATALTGTSPYDLILIDCPPSTGLVVQAALAASHGCIVITQPQHLSVKGVQQSLTFIEEFNAATDTTVHVAGIIVNQMVANQREHQVALEELTAAFGDQVWTPPIPQRAVIQQAIGAHVPITELSEPNARDITGFTRGYLDELARRLTLPGVDLDGSPLMEV